MKKRTLRRSLILTGMGAMIAAGTLTAAPANADETSYLYLLDALGQTVYDTASAVQNGYAVCNLLDAGYTATEAGVQLLVEFPGEATIESAAAMVTAAANELCPWHSGDSRSVIA